MGLPRDRISPLAGRNDKLDGAPTVPKFPSVSWSVAATPAVTAPAVTREQPIAKVNQSQPAPETSGPHPDGLRDHMIGKLKALVSILKKFDEEIAQNEKQQAYYQRYRPEAYEELDKLERERQMLVYKQGKEVTEQIRPQFEKYEGIAKRLLGLSREEIRRAVFDQDSQVDKNTRSAAAEQVLPPWLTTEARTLPGQISPERIYGRRPKPSAAIPPRIGLLLTGQVKEQLLLAASCIPEARTKGKAGRRRKDDEAARAQQLRSEGKPWKDIAKVISQEFKQNYSAASLQALVRSRTKVKR